MKTNIPDNSCKKPCASWGLEYCVKKAVKANRTMFRNMAMGTAEKNNAHFFIFE